MTVIPSPLRSIRGGAALLLVTLLLGTAPRALAQDAGTLDPSFGEAGITTLQVGEGAGDDLANGVAVLPDGRIVVAGDDGGENGSQVFVAVLDAAGAPDPSFGSGEQPGVFTIGFGEGMASATSLALDGEGRIVVAGYFGPDGNADSFVLRLTPDGHLDASFGTADDGAPDGVVVLAPSTSDNVVSTVALQPDGKILVGGLSMESATDDLDFLVVRLDADGSIDKSFADQAGMIKQPIGDADDYVTSLAVNADGSILAAGFVIDGDNANIAVARFTPNGMPDTAFGEGDGIATVSLGSGDDIANSMVIQPDGKILLGGFTSQEEDFDALLLRLEADGAPDTTFGDRGDGIALFRPGEGLDYTMGIAPGADGTILMTGFSGDFALGTENIFLARLDANGALDPAFGAGTADGSPDGFVTLGIDGNDEAMAVAIDQDRNIVLAGSRTAEDGTLDALVARVIGG